MSDLLSLIYSFFSILFKYVLIIFYSFGHVDINENEKIISYVNFIT